MACKKKGFFLVPPPQKKTFGCSKSKEGFLKKKTRRPPQLGPFKITHQMKKPCQIDRTAIITQKSGLAQFF